MPQLLYLQERDPVPIVQEVGGPQGQSPTRIQFLDCPGVGSRYTDYTIPIHITPLNITVYTLRQSFRVQ